MCTPSLKIKDPSWTSKRVALVNEPKSLAAPRFSHLVCLLYACVDTFKIVYFYTESLNWHKGDEAKQFIEVSASASRMLQILIHKTLAGNRNEGKNVNQPPSFTLV
jgi:hypothetical protein